MERRWNDIDKEKIKISEEKKILSHIPFFYHKSHIHWPGIEPELTDRRLGLSQYTKY